LYGKYTMFNSFGGAVKYCSLSEPCEAFFIGRTDCEIDSQENLLKSELNMDSHFLDYIVFL